MAKFITCIQLDKRFDSAGNFIEYIKGDPITVNLDHVTCIKPGLHQRTKQKYTAIYMAGGRYEDVYDEYERVRFWLEQGRNV